MRLVVASCVFVVVFAAAESAWPRDRCVGAFRGGWTVEIAGREFGLVHYNFGLALGLRRGLPHPSESSLLLGPLGELRATHFVSGIVAAVASVIASGSVASKSRPRR
jgi:hypothetical protein